MRECARCTASLAITRTKSKSVKHHKALIIEFYLLHQEGHLIRTTWDVGLNF